MKEQLANCDHRVAKMGTHQVAASEFSAVAVNWAKFTAKNVLTGVSKNPFAYYPSFKINVCCSVCGATFDRTKYLDELKSIKSCFGKWL